MAAKYPNIQPHQDKSVRGYLCTHVVLEQPVWAGAMNAVSHVDVSMSALLQGGHGMVLHHCILPQLRRGRTECRAFSTTTTTSPKLTFAGWQLILILSWPCHQKGTKPISVFPAFLYVGVWGRGGIRAVAAGHTCTFSAQWPKLCNVNPLFPKHNLCAFVHSVSVCHSVVGVTLRLQQYYMCLWVQ